jgi:site-specific DNA-methyltransferase (adenine-specific)
MIINKLNLIQGNCLNLIKQVPTGLVDVICTDPPYLYLNHKLDKPFDEAALFAEWFRVLAPGGFIILFGRGASFYRWGAALSALDFEFKEEIIWDKGYISSPLLALLRVHESVSIWSKGEASINRVKVPYLEMKGDSIESIIQDIKRLKAVLVNSASLDAVNAFLLSGSVSHDEARGGKHSVQGKYNSADRNVNVAKSIVDGQTEKSIIKQGREHYEGRHPAQKPVRLLERLLALVVKRPGAVVLDCFAGSFSTAAACYNMGLSGYFFEIDSDYYRDGLERIQLMDIAR